MSHDYTFIIGFGFAVLFFVLLPALIIFQLIVEFIIYPIIREEIYFWKIKQQRRIKGWIESIQVWWINLHL